MVRKIQHERSQLSGWVLSSVTTRGHRFFAFPRILYVQLAHRERTEYGLAITQMHCTLTIIALQTVEHYTRTLTVILLYSTPIVQHGGIATGTTRAITPYCHLCCEQGTTETKPSKYIAVGSAKLQ